jgi:hypothetical protein
MAKKTSSSDVEITLKNMLDGLNHDVDVLKVDDEKLQVLVTSKQESFSSIKEMLGVWQNSPYPPKEEKLIYYTEKLISGGDKVSEILRRAYIKKIDFSDLDPEKHGKATKSKPIIYKAISEINSGVNILKRQIQTNTLSFKEQEFKPGFAERYANQEFFPEKDYYKSWYDEENDAIILDPKGTKGELITLDNLKMWLPEPPTNKKKILFSDLPKEEQYWRRIEPPKGLTPSNEEEYTDYILEEFRRRREGVFFMNNGKPTWVTGAHYLGLQWNEMVETGGYKEFRKAQCNLYYFALATLLDERCVGMIFTKGRRSGFTEMALDHFVDRSTCVKNRKFGITSKTEDDAEVAFLKYSHTVQNLPFFFRPVVQGKIDDKKKMLFGKPSDNTKTAKQKNDTSTKDYLNVLVDYRATNTLAYDSIAMYLYLGDEAGKWIRPNNYVDHWTNVKPTMIQGGNVVGKALIGSTLNPLDKGGEEFQTLYIGSDVTKRDTNNETSTGLYSYFLPAHQNYERFTDIYGVCHEVLQRGESFINSKGKEQFQGALHYLEAKFASAKKMGAKAYNNTRRLDPITIEDAFRDELQSQLFDIEKINAQLNYNRRCDIQKTLVRGNFEWKDGIKDGTVIWVPKDNGRFLISWIPAQELNLTNRFVKKNIFGDLTKCPVNDNLGSFGCDPYDQSAVIDSKLVATENGVEHNLGSKGALHGYLGTNIGDIPSQQFFLEYIARPKDADMFFEDVLMACLFYSMPIIVENNKKLLLKHFKVRGYRGFCLTRFDKDPSRLSQDEKELGGLPNSSEDIKNYHWTSIEKYIIDYVGEYSPEPGEQEIREVGAMGVMPFNRTLSDWLKFNINKRTDFDASISSGFALMGVNRHKYKPVVERKPVSISFKRMS